MDDVKFAYPSLLDSVSDETASAQFISLKGASAVSEIAYKPLSGSGSSTLVYSILPPSTSTILDSTLLLEMDIQLAVQPAAGDVDVDLGYTCLESWPIQKAIQNISISVNGLTMTHAPYRFQSLYERLEIDDDFRRRYYSMFPSRLNETTKSASTSYYDMLINGSLTGPFSNQLYDGANRFESSRFEFGPRRDVVAGGRTTARTYRVCEPICLGGLFRDAMAYGITNINKLDVTIQFSDMVKLSVCSPRNPATPANVSPFSVAQSLVTANSVVTTSGTSSGAAGGALQNQATVLITRSNEVLRLRYMTSSASIPSVVKLPYTQILPYSNSYTTYLPAAADAITPSVSKQTIQSIKSSMVPSFIYIVARPSLLGYKNELQMDCLFPITSLSLIVGNTVGILSGASPQQLYQISVRNGYNMSWNQWKKQCVICLQVGEDIPGVPGAIGQWSLQAEVGVGWYGSASFGTAANPLPIDIDVFLSNDGQIEISRDMAQLRMGIQTSAIAEKITEPAEDNPEVGAGYGRRHGGSFKSFFRSVGKFLKPVGKALLPIAEKVLVNAGSKALTGLVGAGEGGRALGGARMLGGAEQRRQMQASKLLS